MGAREAFLAHRRVVEDATDELSSYTDKAARIVSGALRTGQTILVCGNGGSAADAQHFAAELVGRYGCVRRGFSAIALTTDTSALTAIGNDVGFERIFARQIEALGRPGDVLIAISTSGNSPNVVQAASEARQRGLRVIALTGRTGGNLAQAADLLLAVPSDDTARTQEVHILCLHALAESVEAELKDLT